MNESQNVLDLDGLLKIAGGHTAFQLLWSGIEFRLFDELSARPGQPIETLAKFMGLEVYPARVLLIGLTALGLIDLEEGLYRNSQIAEARLVTSKEGSLASIIGWQAHIVYPGMMDFVASLRANKNLGLSRFQGTETNLYDRLTHNPFLQSVFQNSMSGLSKVANQSLRTTVDFTRYKHVVDAGGGDGTNALEIARSFPGVKTTVFDSASVCELAGKTLQKLKWRARLELGRVTSLRNPFR